MSAHAPEHRNSSGLSAQVVWDSFRKLNPAEMIRNPVMFVVEAGTVVTLFLTVFEKSPPLRAYDALVTVILFFTILFATFAESYAEARGRAQADFLRKSQRETQAKVIDKNGHVTLVPSSQLTKDTQVVVEAGDVIPGDGEVVDGTGAVDESAITGESAPVLKTREDAVTGGTTLLSDRLLIRITVNKGESFLDRMIALVEGAKRQKTPNEIALTALLGVLTLIFLLVVVTLVPMARYYSSSATQTATMVALLVCLIPTTIGSLLSAIGIAGMNRVSRVNVIAKSGRAVEAAGDIDVIILDKTGTITIGNRMATEFLPLPGVSQQELARASLLASLADDTPEGRSIVQLGRTLVSDAEDLGPDAESVPFSASTRMSGVDLPSGVSIRKGAVSAIQALTGQTNAKLEEIANGVAADGATPLAVAVDQKPLGVIRLKDVVKPGLRERFDDLRAMGIRTIMATGDNRITASVIANEAGVDDFIAEAKPEDKLTMIRRIQNEGKLVAMTGDGTNDAPALAQGDVALAMNSGTMAAKEAANMIDLDSSPTKLLDVVAIGKQLLITRGAITTFSIANDVAKYFAIIPAMFATVPSLHVLEALNVMGLRTPHGAILSALIFNALIIPALIPFAMRGVKYRAESADRMLARNLFNWGVLGVVIPFVGIWGIDRFLGLFGLS